MPEKSQSFEAEFVDAARPHRGIVASAQNLRLLLDGSKFINSQREGNISAAAAVCCIPQYHGPASDATLGAYHTVDTEIDGALGDNMVAKLASGVIHPQSLKMALFVTTEALRSLGPPSVRQNPLVIASKVRIDLTALPNESAYNKSPQATVLIRRKAFHYLARTATLQTGAYG
ncbi:hypothetical protein PsorP6_003163 [Peronosclerospora sorghi]|uniref:Uncharacterized protein n=1 Tax=Peronosclerospora sorghi TaxID=230839 RepID=A0ACC0VL79_9STRA|nr:hypothetical protein PsorP6_003163 [Peronosclerospora sorghi]